MDIRKYTNGRYVWGVELVAGGKRCAVFRRPVRGGDRSPTLIPVLDEHRRSLAEAQQLLDGYAAKVAHWQEMDDAGAP